MNPTLHVCTTCRAGHDLQPGEIPAGKRFHDAIAAAATDINLREVVCLSSCDHGCAAAISAPGKWTYILGRLSEEEIPDLLTYAATYASSKTGTVLPSKRPASLARMILARVPDLSEQPA